MPEATVGNKTSFNVCYCKNTTHVIHRYAFFHFRERIICCDYKYWPVIFLILGSKTEKMDAVHFI